MKRIAWKEGRMVFGGGHTAVAIQEDGRRFWAWLPPGEWSLRREYSTAEGAIRDMERASDGAA